MSKCNWFKKEDNGEPSDFAVFLQIIWFFGWRLGFAIIFVLGVIGYYATE